MKIHILSILTILLYLYCSCNKNNSRNLEIPTVEVYEAFGRKEPIQISQIAEEISYVKLQTEDCPIILAPHVIDIVDTLIIISGWKQLLVFHALDGRFLYQISSHGRGPNEYFFVAEGYDENKGLLYVGLDINTYGMFSIDGELNGTYNLPKHSFTDSLMFRVISTYKFNDSINLGYTDNLTGTAPDKIVAFNNQGKIIRRFSNYNVYSMPEDGHVPLDRLKGWFYNYRDTIRFFEGYTDTIYSISEKSLTPRFFLDMKDLAPVYKLQAKPDSYLEEAHMFFKISNIRESTRYLIFTLGYERYNYVGIYDKITMETRISDIGNDKEFYRYQNNFPIRRIGFENDLDGFIPIGTSNEFYINRHDEMISYIPSYDVKRWFNDNGGGPFDELEPETEDDNPIIIRVKLKGVVKD